MSKICEHCGATIPDNYILCTKCGEAVDDKPNKTKMSKTKKIVVFSCIGVALIGIGLTLYFILRPSIIGEWRASISESGHTAEFILEFSKDDQLTVSIIVDGKLSETDTYYYSIKDKTIYTCRDRKDLDDVKKNCRERYFIKKLTYSQLEVTVDRDSGNTITFTKE